MKRPMSGLIIGWKWNDIFLDKVIFGKYVIWSCRSEKTRQNLNKDLSSRIFIRKVFIINNFK